MPCDGKIEQKVQIDAFQYVCAMKMCAGKASAACLLPDGIRELQQAIAVKSPRPCSSRRASHVCKKDRCAGLCFRENSNQFTLVD
jgi:hypothetical protein